MSVKCWKLCKATCAAALLNVEERNEIKIQMAFNILLRDREKERSECRRDNSAQRERVNERTSGVKCLICEIAEQRNSRVFKNFWHLRAKSVERNLWFYELVKGRNIAWICLAIEGEKRRCNVNFQARWGRWDVMSQEILFVEWDEKFIVELLKLALLVTLTKLILVSELRNIPQIFYCRLSACSWLLHEQEDLEKFLLFAY